MTVDYFDHETKLHWKQVVRHALATAEDGGEELLERTTSHFNALLEHLPRKKGDENDKRAAKMMTRLFAAASETMDSDADKARLELLKNMVSCIIGTSLGVDAFLPESIKEEANQEDNDDEENDEEQPRLSWADVVSKREKDAETAEQQLAWRRSYQAGAAAERREHARTRELAKQYFHREAEHEHEDYGCFEPQYLPDPPSSETFCMPIFFPSEKSYHTFVSALKSAQESLYVCVFSITDNATARALAQAKERGVDVRIITDNEQLECKGSDVEMLNERYDIPFKMDTDEQFMHNKFAVIDRRIVLTGSFNWSISARYHNHENVIITNIPSVVEAYHAEFERIWEMY